VLDGTTRRLVAPALERLAARVDRPAVTPDRVTLLGLALGLGSAAAAAAAQWVPALVLWLLSRVADGLDGVLARRRAAAGEPPSAAGGYLDITADFLVYGATVAGVAIGWGGSLLPFVAVLVAYYLNGATFLAFSSLAERTGRRLDDGRSLSFLGGLARAPRRCWCTACGWCCPARPGRSPGCGRAWSGERPAADGRRVPRAALTGRPGRSAAQAPQPHHRPVSGAARPSRVRTSSSAAFHGPSACVG
jgi:phosphatidylglycerophosphate synthase